MRHRKWVVVLAIIVVAVLPLSYLGLRVATRHPAVKRAVLSRILPRAEAEISIGELEIGLASLRFGDAVIDLERGGSVTIPAASLSLSYRKLLTSGFRLERSLTSAILRDPRLDLVLRPADEDTLAVGGLDPAAIAEALPDYLGVSGGSVSVLDAASGRRFEATQIDLELLRGAERAIEGSAVAGFGTDGGSASIDLRWDAAAESLWLGGEIVELDLADGLPLPGEPPVDAERGRLHATFEASLPSAGSWRPAGSFALRDAVFHAPSVGLRVEDVACDGGFDGGEIAVDAVRGLWNGAAWHGACVLSLSESEILSASVTLLEGDAERLASLVLADSVDLSGRVDLSLDASGALDGPVIRLGLESERLTFRGTDIASLRASGVARVDEVILEEVAASVLGGTAAVRVELERNGGGGGWSARVEGAASDLGVADVAGLAGHTGAAAGALDLRDLAVAIGPGGLRAESLVEWRRASLGGARLGSGVGGVVIDGDDTSLALESSLGCRVSVWVGGRGEEAAIDGTIELAGVRPDSLVAPGAARWIPDLALDGSIEIRGPLSSAEVGGALAFEGARAAGACGLDGTIRLAGPVVLGVVIDSDDAVVSGVPVPFEAEVALEDSALSISDVRVGSIGTAEAAFDLGSPGGVQAGLVVSEAPLADVLALTLGEEVSPAVEGLVFASVSIGGTRDRPTGTAQLQVWSGSAAGVEDLDAAIVARLDGKRIEIPEVVLRRGSEPVLEGGGRAFVDGDLEIALAGQGLPGPLLGGGPDTRFDLEIGVGGRIDAPTFDASVRSFGGEFLGVPFDRFDARVTGARGVVSVDPLGLEKEDSYRVAASARLPVSAFDEGGDSGSIAVDVAGDPVALLASLWDVGASAGGSGRLTAHLAGGRDGFSVVRGTIDARADVLEPGGLFDAIEDVGIAAEIADGFVVSGRLEGRVADGALVIESRRAVTRDGVMLPPLSIAGLDVGVLAISTGEEGVEASVPGLMLPDEFGDIVLRGLDGSPEFLVAGPEDLPRLIGEIEYSNMSFTYPFIESEDGGPGDLLSGADWEIDMKAGRNLWYWRPDAEMRIERDSALRFRGAPSEETLCLSGRVESTEGTVTYVNNDFDVSEAFVEFPPFCEPPRFYVEAATRVDDGTEITLSLNSFETVFTAAAPGAPLDESAVILASDSPDDRTQVEILTKLQYGVSTEMLAGEEQAAMERRRALEVVAAQIGGRVVRPLLSPVEARLRRQLRLDLVRFDIDFVEHFVSQVDQWRAQEGASEYVPFLANSRITLGKYFARDWLISYVGVAETYEEEIGDQRLGLRNELGIEYEVSRNTSLSLRVVYDPSIADWDRRIAIENRYRF